MTDPDRHPSAFALESLAAGETNDTAEATRTHVDVCPHCAAHVAGLRRDALAFESEPRVRIPAMTSPKRDAT